MRASTSPRGFTLIEVMFGVLLLSLVVAGAVQGVLGARLRSTAVTDRVAQGGDRAVEDDHASGAAWMWGGPRVGAVAWVTDSSLDVSVTGLPYSPAGAFQPSAVLSERASLGAWLDGWFAGETSVVPGATRVESGVPGFEGWPDDLSGAEVVLRARRTAGPWGVAWRTMSPVVSPLPDAADTAPPGTPESDPRAPVEPGAPAAAGVVVHRPLSSPVPIRITVDGVDLASTRGEPADSVGSGPCRVSLPDGDIVHILAGTQWQRLRMQPGRWVDVYF